jgi:hypothetical protein
MSDLAQPGMPQGFSDKGPFFLPATPLQPCKLCGHAWKDHTYMYTFQNVDRMRCQKGHVKKDGGIAQCECGKQYEITVAALPAGASEKDVQDAIKRLGDANDREIEKARRRAFGI